MRALLLFVLSVSFLLGEDLAPKTWPIPDTQLGLTAPGNWTMHDKHAGAVLVLRSPLPADRKGDDAERARGIIAVAVQNVKDDTPKTFADRCRLDLERTASGLVLDKNQELIFGGRTWTKQSYRMQVGQFTFTQELYTNVINGVGICVTCSCTADGYRQWQAAFDAVLASLGRSRLKIE
jgi:hypothetical protein